MQHSSPREPNPCRTRPRYCKAPAGLAAGFTSPIQKNREALKFLRERAEPAAPSLNGMPHASGVKDSTGRLAVEIADMDARITYLEEQAEQERDKAVAFCSTIQDARLYLIFRLRFVRCLTWAEVADLLGDYYTEEGVCRMAYNYLAKTEKEKPTAQSA